MLMKYLFHRRKKTNLKMTKTLGIKNLGNGDADITMGKKWHVIIILWTDCKLVFDPF